MNRTADDVAKLKDLLDPPVSSDPRDRFEHNREFHRAVFSASGNRQLTHHLDQLWDRTERYRIVLVANEIERQLPVTSATTPTTIIGPSPRPCSRAMPTGSRTCSALHVQRSHDLIRAMLAAAI